MSIVTAFLSSFLLFQVQTTPEYTIEAVRYGTLSQYRVASLVVGFPGDERLDIAMVVWLIRGGGRTILLDTGFFREGRMDRSGLVDYLRPDEAVGLAAVEPRDVTDIIITHAHWDHAWRGGTVSRSNRVDTTR
jgi:glyoxylase-like metal-dependent hydrolase (beta-lactamase superfamily II)